MNKEDQLTQEFVEKVRKLEKRYIEMIIKLKDVPNQIPEEQFTRDRELIIKRIEDKMAYLSDQFKKNVDIIADEFIKKQREV